MNKVSYISKKEYESYRLDVLSRTDGKSIHSVNGLLGRILNWNEDANYWKNKNPAKSKKALKERDKTMQDIVVALKR